MNRRARLASPVALGLGAAWLLALVTTPTLAAEADEPPLRVARVLGGGRVALAMDDGELPVRLVGLAFDRPTSGLDALLLGPAEPVVTPGRAVGADGTPLVVLLRDGLSLNDEAVRLGLARVDPETPDADRPRFLALEAEARRRGLGLWAPPEPGPGPERESVPTAEVEEVEAVPASAAFAPPWLDPATIRGALAELGLGPIDLLGRLACGVLGVWVARERRRRVVEGLVLGLAFGVVGGLIAALLPAGGGRDRRSAGPSASDDDLVVRPLGVTSPNGSSVIWDEASSAEAVGADWFRSDDDLPILADRERAGTGTRA